MLLLISLLLLSLLCFHYLPWVLAGCTVKEWHYFFNEEDIDGAKQKELRLRTQKTLRHPALPSMFCAILLAVFDFAAGSVHFYHLPNIRLFIAGIVTVLMWKVFFYPGLHQAGKKTLFVIFGVGAWFSPCFLPLIIFIYLHHFKGWLHHDQMMMRVLKMVTALALAAGAFAWLSKDEVATSSAILQAFYILIFSIIGSHYIVPGAAKLRAGSNWYTWARQNELAYLLASAYIWGWLKFLPKERFIWLFRLVRPLSPYLKIYALVTECGFLFVMLDKRLAACLMLMCIMLHTGIFLLSGLLFLGNILCMTFALAFLIIPLSNGQGPFQPTSCVLSFLILLLPLKRIIWAPQTLTWWDTPFAGRIHWRAEGESGTIYELYNDFFSPHDRLFGRAYGYFLIDEKIVYAHLGEVHDYELRNRILASKGDKQEIEAIKNEFGRSHRDHALEAIHDTFVRSFVERSWDERRGKLNTLLRYLRYPCGQWYFWGEYPAYRYQEKLKKVILHFNEEFFTGSEFVVQKNYKIKELTLYSGDESPVPVK